MSGDMLRNYPVKGRAAVDSKERRLQEEYEDALWDMEAVAERFREATISLSVYQRKHPAL